MNAQRLVTLANLVHSEMRSANLVKILKDLTNKVQEAINGPNENTQRAVEQVVSQLTSTLQGARTNRLSPGLRGDLDEIRVGEVPATRLLGTGLLKQLNEVFENGYTSVQTLDRLRKIQEQVSLLDTGLQ